MLAELRMALENPNVPAPPAAAVTKSPRDDRGGTSSSGEDTDADDGLLEADELERLRAQRAEKARLRAEKALEAADAECAPEVRYQ